MEDQPSTRYRIPGLDSRGHGRVDLQVGFISSLAVDSSGNLFFTDLIGQRIRKIDTNGIIISVGGDGIPGYSGDGGSATDASINYPFGLTTDTRGNVYLSDLNQAVRILRPVAHLN
jgi:hypothetical protein